MNQTICPFNSRDLTSTITYASLLPHKTEVEGEMATSTMTSRPPQLKKKKEARTEIWSSLLRQTREAQARNRTQAIQHRSLIVCGGSPDDQRSFVQNLTRPPPAQKTKQQRQAKGELRLSNRYAYGYGHLTLYSSGNAGVLGAEEDEVARVEVHTLPDASEQYASILRELLDRKKKEVDAEQKDAEAEETEEAEERRPGVCILMSWKEPWKFLDQLKKWLQLLAQALLQPGVAAADPLDVLKEAQLSITVVVQHTETQEDLFREGYKEEDFDFISQCLRTAILPLHPLSALVYTASAAPPQQPGSALTEPQKVIFNSMGLDLAALSPKRSRSSSGAERKEELKINHEFMDRMAIVIPAGWDSPAYIRTLSENFSPEDIVSGWLEDLQPLPPSQPQPSPKIQEEDDPNQASAGAAEVYESSPVDDEASELELTSPIKPSSSAISSYKSRVLDPLSHKRVTTSPVIEITTKPDQTFLKEMREHLQQLEQQDREKPATSGGVSNTGLSSSSTRVGSLPSGESTGALSELGDVSFNVGGVSYDTISAEAAINALKTKGRAGDGEIRTPKPRGPGGRKEESTPGSGLKSPPTGNIKSPQSGKDPLDVDKLEEYFQSLLNKSGGSGSKSATPTKRGGSSD